MWPLWKCQMRVNLVQFFSKQENQARIITLVNNQYENYQLSFIKLLFFTYSLRNIILTNYTIHRLYRVNKVQIRSDVVPSLALQRHWGRNKRCKVIDSVRLRNKNILTISFFSTNHHETHAIFSTINKIYSNKRMAANNKWNFLTPLKFFYM